jgi:carbon storage regulator
MGMLVLSRQRDESIMIGHDIEITIIDIRGDKVRIGVNAPKTVSVHRKEVYEAIERENAAARAANLSTQLTPGSATPQISPGASASVPSVVPPPTSNP